jgi:hypothetical protein
MRWARRTLADIWRQGIVQPFIWRRNLGRFFLASSYREAQGMAQWTADASRARVARGKNETRPDLYGAFTDAKHPKTGRTFDRRDLFTESIVLLGAGTSESHVPNFLPFKPY